MFLFLLLATTRAFMRTIPSGHVGVYSWMGQLRPDLRYGVSFYAPGVSTITTVKFVQNEDTAKEVQCTSSDGVRVYIPWIQIANRIQQTRIVPVVTEYGFHFREKLVVAPVSDYMRKICVNLTVEEIEIKYFHQLSEVLRTELQRQVDVVQSGMTIDWVRIGTIIVPDAIREKRLQLAIEKAKKTVVEEKTQRITQEKQQEAFVQTADLQRARATHDLQNEMDIQNAKTNAEISLIETMRNVDKKRIECNGGN